MKKIIPFVAIIGVGALLINFLKRKAAAGQNLKFELLKVSIDTVRTKQARLLKIFYDVTINMINVENASVVVNNINLNVTVNGKNLGNLEQTLNFSVPAQSTKAILLKASFNTLGALSLVKDIILNGINFTVNINGFIDTDLGRVNVNFDKQIGGTINGYSKKKNYC
jgi:LEA14-like dessication related protein